MGVGDADLVETSFLVDLQSIDETLGQPVELVACHLDLIVPFVDVLLELHPESHQTLRHLLDCCSCLGIKAMAGATQVAKREFEETRPFPTKSLGFVGSGILLNGRVEVVTEDHLHAELAVLLLSLLGGVANVLVRVDVAHECVAPVGLREDVGDPVERHQGVLEGPHFFWSNEFAEDSGRGFQSLVGSFSDLGRGKR